MCKNKDIVFSRGCVEKNPVCAVCPQPLHSCWSGCSPPWTQAGKCRQDLNRLWWRRVVGVPSSIPTPESVCLACSGGVMRVTKVLGYVCVGRRACVDLLCDWGTWAPQACASGCKSCLGCWGAAYVLHARNWAITAPRVHYLLCALALQCSQENGTYVGKVTCLIDVVFSGQILSMAQNTRSNTELS